MGNGTDSPCVHRGRFPMPLKTPFRCHQRRGWRCEEQHLGLVAVQISAELGFGGRANEMPRPATLAGRRSPWWAPAQGPTAGAYIEEPPTPQLYLETRDGCCAPRPLIAVSFHRLLLGRLLPSRACFRFAGYIFCRSSARLAQCLLRFIMAR